MKVNNVDRQDGPRDHQYRVAKAVAILGTLAVAVNPSAVHSEELQNFIRDLYGGNGIFLGVSPGAFQHSAHFASDSLTKLSDLDQEVATNVNLSAITPSAPSFTFDILQGMPSDTENSLGPVFGERAETIGQGKFNLAVSFTHVGYTELNGQNLNGSVRDTRVDQPDRCCSGPSPRKSPQHRPRPDAERIAPQAMNCPRAPACPRWLYAPLPERS
jgi:hypothetical protein